MPTTEWLNKYESIKDKLVCKTDLDAYFTEKVIGNMGVDVLDIGAAHFSTGTIFACDPLMELEDTPPDAFCPSLPYIQSMDRQPNTLTSFTSSYDKGNAPSFFNITAPSVMMRLDISCPVWLLSSNVSVSTMGGDRNVFTSCS